MRLEKNIKTKRIMTMLSTVVLSGCLLTGCSNSTKNEPTETSQTIRETQTAKEIQETEPEIVVDLSKSVYQDTPILDTETLKTMHVYNCKGEYTYIDKDKVIEALDDPTLKLISKESKDYPVIGSVYEHLEYEGEKQDYSIKIGPWGVSIKGHEESGDFDHDEMITQKIIENVVVDDREEVYATADFPGYEKAMNPYGILIEGVPYTQKCYIKGLRNHVPGFSVEVHYQGGISFKMGVKYKLGKVKKGATLLCQTEEDVYQCIEQYLKDTKQGGTYEVGTRLVYAREDEEDKMLIVPMLEVELFEIGKDGKINEVRSMMLSLYSSQGYEVSGTFSVTS